MERVNCTTTQRTQKIHQLMCWSTIHIDPLVQLHSVPFSCIIDTITKFGFDYLKGES